MKWWRRARPDGPPGTETDVTVSDETLRARAAARKAAVELAQVRAQAPTVARSSAELDDLNRHNGYYLLIRRAFHS